MIDQDVHRRPVTKQAACPTSWLWGAWHERHTSLCPQTMIQWGTLLKPPGGQVQQCFGNECHSWNLEQPLVPNIGMAPCKSKGQPTFGISGSLKAAIERNVKVVFWVRVWHCVFTIDAHSHWTYRHHARTVPMRLFDTSSRWQCCPCHLWHLLSARPPCCLFSPSHGCFLL
jgi:hypothetical protein